MAPQAWHRNIAATGHSAPARRLDPLRPPREPACQLAQQKALAKRPMIRPETAANAYSHFLFMQAQQLRNA